ncbi:MAG: YwaF family protein [Clostridia bacterium]|nr:YwaF family protein [Clostridia bacterium]
MFTTNHIIWLIISFLLIGAGLYFLLKKRPPLRLVLKWASIFAVVAEAIRLFSTVEMVPSTDGSMMYPYLDVGQLPLHLCSIQMIFIFYTRFAKDCKFRENLLAFMYPTCGVGAAFSLFIPIVFDETITVSQAFTHPLAYQYFLYHVMLILLGLYIPFSKEFEIKPRHYLSTVGLLGAMGFVSIFLNSVFASPTYINGELVSVDYATNFFFTNRPPINIPLTTETHWFIYLGVIGTMVIVIAALFYLPFFVKAWKTKKSQ